MPHSLKNKIKSLCYKGEITEKERDRIIRALKQQPSEDCISRTRLLSRIDAERKHLLDLKMDGAEHIIVHHARRIIEDMPSVTPKPCEEENPNCTECRYYDKEKYHCPRFCRVIENTVAEITSGQERPTAHFIRYINHNYSPFDNSPEYIMRCSNCGGALSEGAFYCPNCGAKMEGETNDR